MKDYEFYTVSEDWPQPPDDPCTLQAAWEPTITVTAPKKKKNGRIRKKLSESLAGVTAAAVAVVMVASALPTMKDIFEEDIVVDGTVGGTVVESTPIIEVVGEPCPMCGERNCPYYILPEGAEGLRLTYTEEPEYLEYDLYAMNGFNTQDLDTAQYAAAINTETDQRLALRIDKEIDNLLEGSQDWLSLQDSLYIWGAEATGVSGFKVGFEDEKSINDTHVLYVYLAYSPSGVCSAEHIAVNLGIQAELAGLQFNAFKVAGIENAELHVYSDQGEDFNQAVWECCFVDVITEPDCSFILGKTMRLQEGTVVHRTFEDVALWESGYYVPVSQEKGDLWIFEASFSYKAYAINDMTITFATTSWLELFAQWEDLNDLAPKYGHQVCFPIYYLGETSANGITYQCYATYAADIGEDHYVTYLVVPQQEQEILISFTEYFFEEEMTALLSGELDGENIADTYEIFSQITLR